MVSNLWYITVQVKRMLPGHMTTQLGGYLALGEFYFMLLKQTAVSNTLFRPYTIASFVFACKDLPTKT
jgi:hypothetical protein